MSEHSTTLNIYLIFTKFSVITILLILPLKIPFKNGLFFQSKMATMAIHVKIIVAALQSSIFIRSSPLLSFKWAYLLEY